MRKFLSLFLILLVFSTAVAPMTHARVEMNLTDEELLELIQEKTFNFFLKERNAGTGLVADRAHNFGGRTRSAASIASVGFALSSYPVGVERGWLDYATAYEISRRTLLFFLKQAPHEKGFFYHFMNMETGKRAGRSELSPIDTALFLAGALFVADYFQEQELKDLALKIYERVDWQWMLHGGDALALAWSPEQGFNKRRWDHYDESMIMYLLAIGSPTHPIPAETWKKIKRPIGIYGGYPVIQMPPLFTHQYSHIWVDFRNKNDGFADYFQNSVNASLANRQFCIDQSSKFSTYGPNAWGLTASDGPFGYKAYGAPPGWSNHDGTLAPTGCGSSIVFTPKESMSCLRHYYENHGDKLWGTYGFADAFNLDKEWVGQDVIGIDQGALLLMLENFRSELIWNVMAKNEYLTSAMEKVGFKPGTIKLEPPQAPKYTTPYVAGGIDVDGFLKDWAHGEAIILDLSHKEGGSFENEKDLNGEIRFAWDETALYFSAKVTDQDMVLRKKTRNIWMDDLLELYIDPQGDGLIWKDESDFQIGFRPEEKTGFVHIWSWFQDDGDELAQSGAIQSRSYVDEKGYILEGSIKWSFLGVYPEKGKELRVSAALHDIDRDRSEGKLQWHFVNANGHQKFELGRLIFDRN